MAISIPCTNDKLAVRMTIAGSLESFVEYNLMIQSCVYNCNRCVFSKDGDLSVVDKISKENPQVLDIPKTRLSWGGKEFLPK